METNQSINGKVSREVCNTLYFAGFSILLRTRLFVFSNVVGLFKKKIALLCSQVMFRLVNSFSNRPVHGTHTQ